MLFLEKAFESYVNECFYGMIQINRFFYVK